MLLEWKKSGRSVCGKYQANKTGAYYLPVAHYRGSILTEKLADVAECAADNRAICQRQEWATMARQSINYVLMQLATATQTGAAVLSHALKVDSSQVSRWKLGRALVPADHCERIMHLCNVASINPAMLRPDLEFWHDAAGQLRWRKRSAIAGGAEL